MFASRSKLAILLTLYLVVFLNAIGYFLTIPTLVDIIANPSYGIIPQEFLNQWGNYVYSIVLGAGSIAGILFAPILGRLSDVIGRRKTLLLCVTLTFISLILPVIGILNSSIAIFTLGNMVNGIASNNQPIAQAAITDITPAHRSKAIRFSIDTFVICAAMTLGPMVGSLLSDHQLVSWFNHTTPFIAAALLTFVAIILLAWLFPETNTHLQTQQKTIYHASILSFLDIGKLSPSLKRLLLVFVLAQTGWAEFFQYLYIYLSMNLHFTQIQVSLYTGLIGVYLSIGLLLIYPYWIKRTSFRRSVNWCLLISMISMFLLGLFSQPWALWLFVIPLSLAIGMYFPSLLTIFSDETAAHNQGWIMAIASSLIGVAWLITGFGSIYFSHFGAQVPIMAAAFCLLGSLVVMIYDNGKAS